MGYMLGILGSFKVTMYVDSRARSFKALVAREGRVFMETLRAHTSRTSTGFSTVLALHCSFGS